MRPAEGKLGVILDNYAEIEELRAAQDSIWAYVPEELIDDIVMMLPDLNAVMATHEEILPMVAEKGGEAPQPYLFLSGEKVVVAALFLAVQAVANEAQDPLIGRSAYEMQVKLGENLRQSRELIRINPEADVESKE
jgi:hypothetical protein